MVSFIAGGFFTNWAIREAHMMIHHLVLNCISLMVNGLGNLHVFVCHFFWWNICSNLLPIFYLVVYVLFVEYHFRLYFHCVEDFITLVWPSYCTHLIILPNFLVWRNLSKSEVILERNQASFQEFTLHHLKILFKMSMVVKQKIIGGKYIKIYFLFNFLYEFM